MHPSAQDGRNQGTRPPSPRRRPAHAAAQPMLPHGPRRRTASSEGQRGCRDLAPHSARVTYMHHTPRLSRTTHHASCAPGQCCKSADDGDPIKNTCYDSICTKNINPLNFDAPRTGSFDGTAVRATRRASVSRPPPPAPATPPAQAPRRHRPCVVMAVVAVSHRLELCLSRTHPAALPQLSRPTLDTIAYR